MTKHCDKSEKCSVVRRRYRSKFLYLKHRTSQLFWSSPFTIRHNLRICCLFRSRSGSVPMSECTMSAIRLFARFCEMFSEISTVVMQLPCCPGKQGELSEKCLQNLRNDLMAKSVVFTQPPLLHLLFGCPLPHSCQMAIARFLDRMCLAIRASGQWLRYATL